MKIPFCKSIRHLLFLSLLGASGACFAQERIEATNVTTTAEGTVSEFGSKNFVVKTEAGSQPVRHLSDETTNFVDEAGRPVSPEMVRAGYPVTVHYTKVGDTLIATKVVVRTSPTPAPATVAREATTTTATRPATETVEHSNATTSTTRAKTLSVEQDESAPARRVSDDAGTSVQETSGSTVSRETLERAKARKAAEKRALEEAPDVAPSGRARTPASTEVRAEKESRAKDDAPHESRNKGREDEPQAERTLKSKSETEETKRPTGSKEGSPKVSPKSASGETPRTSSKAASGPSSDARETKQKSAVEKEETIPAGQGAAKDSPR